MQRFYTQNLPMHRTAMAPADDSLGAGATGGAWGRAGQGRAGQGRAWQPGPVPCPSQAAGRMGQPQPRASGISLGMGLGRDRAGTWAHVWAWRGRAHGRLALLQCSWSRDRQPRRAEMGSWAVGRVGGALGEARQGL